MSYGLEHLSRPLTRELDKQSSLNFDDSRSIDDVRPFLERSPEIENIPQECFNKRNKNSLMYKDKKEIPSPPPSPTYNDTHRDIVDGVRGSVKSPTADEDTPPPPPPIYRDEASTNTTPRSTKTASILSCLESTHDTKGSLLADSRDDLTKKLFRTSMNASVASSSASHLDELMFNYLDPLFRHHVALLKDLEHRMAIWEGKLTSNMGGDHQRIGDILIASLPRVLKLYNAYMLTHGDILLEIENLLKKCKAFEKMYNEFELKKHCYLPLISFLQRPAQRISHYCHLLDKLMKVYGSSNSNYPDCEACYKHLVEAMGHHGDRIETLENTHKLIELQRDLKFIREGCLQKLSRRGFQQRMFLLFNDTFLYMSRTGSSHLQFKVHGQLSTLNMKVDNIDEGDSTYGVPNAFNVISGNKTLKLAASNVEEKHKWIEDLDEAIRFNNENHMQNNMYSTIKSNGSTDTLDDTLDISGEMAVSSPSVGATGYRVNTTMHVCWHRNTSVCLKDISTAGQNHFSGYVLRKFKNSNGWQKLWVIFTNFCLFFYKTFQDEFPLASLPLLGYAITTPNTADNINKEFVFKLQFKNHVYYFRAESQYTFDRWMSVISSATSTSRRVRAFSRFESTASK